MGCGAASYKRISRPCHGGVILDDVGIEEIQDAVSDLAYCKKADEMKHYQYLIDILYDKIQLNRNIKVYDDRIREVLDYTEKCDCSVHTSKF